MSRNKQSLGFFGMGASLLLTVFLVLMLVTFSLLSLSTAREDARRTELFAERRLEYYEMCNEAEVVICRVLANEDPGVDVEKVGDEMHFEIFGRNSGVLSVNFRLHPGKTEILEWKMEPR